MFHGRYALPIACSDQGSVRATPDLGASVIALNTTFSCDPRSGVETQFDLDAASKASMCSPPALSLDNTFVISIRCKERRRTLEEIMGVSTCSVCSLSVIFPCQRGTSAQSTRSPARHAVARLRLLLLLLLWLVHLILRLNPLLLYALAHRRAYAFLPFPSYKRPLRLRRILSTTGCRSRTSPIDLPAWPRYAAASPVGFLGRLKHTRRRCRLWTLPSIITGVRPSWRLCNVRFDHSSRTTSGIRGLGLALNAGESASRAPRQYQGPDESCLLGKSSGIQPLARV